MARVSPPPARAAATKASARTIERASAVMSVRRTKRTKRTKFANVRRACMEANETNEREPFL